MHPWQPLHHILLRPIDLHRRLRLGTHAVRFPHSALRSAVLGGSPHPLPQLAPGTPACKAHRRPTPQYGRRYAFCYIPGDTSFRRGMRLSLKSSLLCSKPWHQRRRPDFFDFSNHYKIGTCKQAHTNGHNYSLKVRSQRNGKLATRTWESNKSHRQKPKHPERTEVCQELEARRHPMQEWRIHARRRLMSSLAKCSPRTCTREYHVLVRCTSALCPTLCGTRSTHRTRRGQRAHRCKLQHDAPSWTQLCSTQTMLSSSPPSRTATSSPPRVGLSKMEQPTRPPSQPSRDTRCGHGCRPMMCT